MATVTTSECKNCPHCTIKDKDKSKVKIFCDYKNKEYFYGQYVPCDYLSGGSRKRGRKKNVKDGN